jgi:hypothetical protein
MYWWWRVRDGGMTLSFETIYSLPLVKFEIDNDLVEVLKKSEKENLVYKMNAGSVQENVKHETDLVARLNTHILPEFAQELLLTHTNSELDQLRHMEEKENQ